MIKRSKPSNAIGTGKAFVDGSPENIYKIGGGDSKIIGPIEGRYNRYKTKVSALNDGTGGPGGRDALKGSDNI